MKSYDSPCLFLVQSIQTSDINPFLRTNITINWGTKHLYSTYIFKKEAIFMIQRNNIRKM